MRKGFQLFAIGGLTLLIALFLNAEAFAVGANGSGDTTSKRLNEETEASGDVSCPEGRQCGNQNVSEGQVSPAPANVSETELCKREISGLNSEQSSEVQAENCRGYKGPKESGPAAGSTSSKQVK